MTALEIFEKRIKIGTLSQDYGHIVDDVLHIDDAYELYTIEKALNEHEALKKDVARYFKLLEQHNHGIETREEMYERWDLYAKLSKVGKEE